MYFNLLTLFMKMDVQNYLLKYLVLLFPSDQPHKPLPEKTGQA